jgi:hypothetical protein
MNDKINMVGIVWVVLGVLTCLGAGFVMLGGGAMLAGFASGGDHDAAVAGSMVAGFMGILAICILVMGIFEIVAGLALRKHRPWARIAIIILAILNILGFPIGTIVGIFSLIVLLSAEAKPVFAA